MNLHSKKAALIWTILMVLSGLFPVLLALILYLNPAVIAHLPLLCAVVGLAAFLADSPSKPCRILCGSLGALLLCLHGALVFSHPWPLLLIPVLYLAQLLFLIRPHPGTSFFQLPFFLSCLAIYGAFQFGMMTLPNIPWAAAFLLFPVLHNIPNVAGTNAKTPCGSYGILRRDQCIVNGKDQISFLQPPGITVLVAKSIVPFQRICREKKYHGCFGNEWLMVTGIRKLLFDGRIGDIQDRIQLLIACSRRIYRRSQDQLPVFL